MIDAFVLSPNFEKIPLQNTKLHRAYQSDVSSKSTLTSGRVIRLRVIEIPIAIFACP